MQPQWLPGFLHEIQKFMHFEQGHERVQGAAGVAMHQPDERRPARRFGRMRHRLRVRRATWLEYHTLTLSKLHSAAGSARRVFGLFEWFEEEIAIGVSDRGL